MQFPGWYVDLRFPFLQYVVLASGLQLDIQLDSKVSWVLNIRVAVKQNDKVIVICATYNETLRDR